MNKNALQKELSCGWWLVIDGSPGDIGVWLNESPDTTRGAGICIGVGGREDEARTHAVQALEEAIDILQQPTTASLLTMTTK